MPCEIYEVDWLEPCAHLQYFNYESANIGKLFKGNVISEVSSKTRDVLKILLDIYDGVFLEK